MTPTKLLIEALLGGSMILLLFATVTLLLVAAGV